jgi:N-acetylglucosaminylphosphatidylinositol deacetylase
MLTILAFVVAALASLLLRPLSSNNVLQGGQRVLLLTAHPDDECLFFAPTLLSLRAEVELYSLCLSVGDAEGLGRTRRVELQSSLDVLGIEEDKRWVVDSP